MSSSDSNLSTVENEESSGELFADLPTKSKRGGFAPPSSGPKSQVSAAASLVGSARPSMPSSSGVHAMSPVPPPPPSRIPAPPTSAVPAPPSARISAPPPPPSKAAVIAQAEYLEDNGDDATPVRAPVDGTPTVKLPDVAIVRAMTSSASAPPSARPVAHVPPPASARSESSMVPPPSVQSQHVAEIPQVASVPRDMLHSAPPTSMSQPPPPPQQAKGGASKLLVAAAAVLVLAVGGLAAKQAGVAGFGAKDGTLLASVAGPGGSAIDKFELFVDGSKRCEASPCKVDGLTEGEHFLKVMAPGYESSAAISISVKGGATTDQRVDLVPSKDGATAVKADSPAEKPKDEALSLEDLGKKKPAEETKADDDKAPSSSSGAAKAPTGSKVAAKEDAPAKDKEEAKDSAAASDKGMINISSIPPVNVVVDGKPIGMAPKTVRVAAGSHTIVFIGAEGRQVRSVNVKGGGSTSVAVKF
ncbi:MAG: hypothetical protein H6718_36610 [Polyangiaceae bacterium]|nr:hypothetical protein [Myxococcales bacterium]MCB9590985.1 hypothetical protein [Polyangiaceae bacterium]